MKTEDEAIRIREVYLRTGSIQAAARECGCTWRTAKAALARDYSLDEGKTRRHVKQNIWNERIQQLILQNIPHEAKCVKIRLTAKRITDIIQAEGATLSARQVQRIASRIRENIRNAKSDDAKLITRGIPGCWQVCIQTSKMADSIDMEKGTDGYSVGCILGFVRHNVGFRGGGLVLFCRDAKASG